MPRPAAVLSAAVGPAGAIGVILNLTVTQANGAGFVTAHPGGGARPNASVLNYSAGEDIANMVTATLSAAGTLDLYNAQSSVHLIADVAGYLTPDGGSGTPGPQGPQGPQGPAGPTGPAGPGATVIVNQAVPNPTGSQVIGTFAGFTLSASCGPAGATGLTFDAVADGLLRITGSKDYFTDAATSSVLVGSGAGIWSETVLANNQFVLSGVVDAAGVTSAIEIGIALGSPCRVWGTIVPSA